MKHSIIMDIDHQKDIMNWLYNNPQLFKIDSKIVYEVYKSYFRDKSVSHSKFGRFLSSQGISRKSARINKTMANVYTPKNNLTLEYRLTTTKTPCEYCNGKGYKLQKA